MFPWLSGRYEVTSASCRVWVFTASISYNSELCCDVSRAFDKVHHSFLLIKLRHLNFNSRLHNWFRSYLLGRRQQVIVLGVTSQELNFLLVAARVPFGTNVAFGIRQRLKQIYCTLSVACFADNTKLYQRADSIADGGALLSDMTVFFNAPCISLREAIFARARGSSTLLSRRKIRDCPWSKQFLTH